ncbi:MAG: hypothetical protein ACRDYW_09450 [Acidimicrobiales bacterium]
MASLPELLRSLGTQRALDNARGAILRHEREAWLVAGLERRLESRDEVAAAPPAATQVAHLG